ncbi:hypothetical protein C6P40_002127 [Pichia californica]|uniref:Uncharacterized protein n=1 Tax=Pichia californica TaxID=460514 RepID=A0A9P6WQV2_9ASCO|nr:hypothetical protein C6P42_001381 [[Candida] californica]KAG0690628.1 hypothetical protein C6P40_002127 [[Candida] californica]
MSDEEFYIRREVEEEENDDYEQQQQPEANESVFDNEFRILVLANTGISADVESEDGAASAGINVEESDMEELLVRQVRTLDDVNEFFDEFDSTIAEPNEGHLKYEVGSDGLCVVLVDNVKLKETVVSFVQSYMEKHPVVEPTNSESSDMGKQQQQQEEERSTKRRK